jgi:ATP-dependent DNA helicase PIF1
MEEEVLVESKFYNNKEYLIDTLTNEIYSEEGEIIGLWMTNHPILIDAIKNLDPKQVEVLDRFKRGENVFMSGSAGTGKSHLIKIMKMYCSAKDKKHQVTALTGCAALLLECSAKTIHSWAGIGPCNDKPSVLLKRCRKRGKIRIWKKIDVLIVDEVSMMSRVLFESLDFIGKTLRGNNKPYGGIQLVFSGDFYQLPPVSSGSELDNGQFCFESEIWNETFPETQQLTKIFRQKDIQLAKILNNIRRGVLKKKDVQALRTRQIPFPKMDIIPTILYPIKRNVFQKNQLEHDKLSSEGSRVYKMNVSLTNQDNPLPIQVLNLDAEEPGAIKANQQFLKENNLSASRLRAEIEFHQKHMAGATELELRVGDQVMVTCNLTDTIVNGSRGVVIENVLDEGKWCPRVKFMNGLTRLIKQHTIVHDKIKGLRFNFMPLTYAWALTIHKCQGTTLDFCVMDIGSGIFECGQTYVALSRVKELSGLYLMDFDPLKIKINRKVKEFYGH